MQRRRLLAMAMATACSSAGRARAARPGAHLEQRGLTFYLDNTEFFNPYRTGETLLGGQILSYLSAALGPRTEVVAGFYGNHQSGDSRFPRPVQADPRLPLSHRPLARRARHARHRGPARLPRAARGHPLRHHPSGRVRRPVARAASGRRRRGVPQLAAAQHLAGPRGVRLRPAAPRRSGRLAQARAAGPRAPPWRPALSARASPW